MQFVSTGSVCRCNVIASAWCLTRWAHKLVVSWIFYGSVTKLTNSVCLIQLLAPWIAFETEVHPHVGFLCWRCRSNFSLPCWPCCFPLFWLTHSLCRKRNPQIEVTSCTGTSTSSSHLEHLKYFSKTISEAGNWFSTTLVNTGSINSTVKPVISAQPVMLSLSVVKKTDFAGNCSGGQKNITL